MEIYPDEVAQSFVARLFRVWGYSQNRSLLRQLLPIENMRTRARIELSLRTIAGAAGISDAEWFASQHTLLPYQLAAEPESVRRSMVLAATAGSAGRWSPRLAARTSGWDGPVYFRFCLGCASEDVAQFRETYWHRIHQLPGVTRCPKHRRALRSSLYPIYPASAKDLQAADAVVLGITGGSKVAHFLSLPVHRRICRRSLQVLNGAFDQDINLDALTYRRSLERCGFRKRNGTYSEARIGAELRDFLGVERSLEHIGKRSWWANVYRERRAFHLTPLQHMILQTFLACKGVRLEHQLHS